MSSFQKQRVFLRKKTKVICYGVEVERANVQIGYVMLNVLGLREHNVCATSWQKNYPTWDDERLFQTARNILLVEILRIVEDYVNHITPLSL